MGGEGGRVKYCAPNADKNEVEKTEKGFAMLRGLYISATGMLSQQSRMNVITNNIANAETAGYKTDELFTRSFADMLIQQGEDPAVVNKKRVVGPLNTGIHIDEIHTSYAQGPIEETGVGTDIAIQGDAFFTVQGPEGVFYTRSGNFTVNQDGYLVTADGYAVLGQNGPVRVGTGDFSVDAAGAVQVNGNTVDRLRMAAFADNAGLRKVGDSLFTNYSGQPEQARDYALRQGSLENSNVEVVDQIVDMITVQRAYEANQKIVQMTDETFGRAVNDIGSL
jgi:flagellar basal-body rod protein FlgF